MHSLVYTMDQVSNLSQVTNSVKVHKTEGWEDNLVFVQMGSAWRRGPDDLLGIFYVDSVWQERLEFVHKFFRRLRAQFVPNSGKGQTIRKHAS